jgi:hypothetical protein
MAFNCPNSDDFAEDFWNADTLDECHFSDALWGYTVRVFKEFRNRDEGRWTDPVFNRLITMGCEDWRKADTRGPQAILAMRYSVALASRLNQRIMRAEETVGVSDS